jgi:hypothetical protein
MTDVLDDIKDYLVTNHLGTFGTDLFIGYMPPSPDQCTVIKPGGGPPVDHHSAGAWPLVDFDCRAVDASTAMGMVEAILALFTDLTGLTINSNYYIRIQSYYPGPQQFYPWDDLNRAIWSGTLKINMRPIYVSI